MKKLMILLCIFTCAFILQIDVIYVNAQQKRLTQSDNLPGEEGNSKRSPYFFVEGDPQVDHFPLLKTEAAINVAGVIAEVELTQVYKNSGKKTIEAMYVFPLGTKSAIHAMQMKIGERVVKANIEEREQAQKKYQSAKEEGKVASLLEQQRPNVFQMKVANIMPGDEVEVVVNFTEMLVPEEGIYEFVFPTVVGPRYTGEKDEADLEGKDKWLATPHLHEGEEPPYLFNVKANVKTGPPLAKVWVPSHKVETIIQDVNETEVLLSPEEEKAGNKDFILRYTLQGEVIDTGLLLYPGEEENVFLLMIEPPERVALDMVPPREYIFIVDVSGSMNGFPLEVSKTLLKRLVGNLREKDYFNVLFFAGGSKMLSPYPLPATRENREKALEMLMSQRGGGGTHILDALQRVLSLEKKEGLSRTIICATDGYVAVEKEVFDLIRNNLSRANFFAFGIGNSVNRHLIEGMARAGRGEPFVVTTEKEAEKTAEKFIRYIEHPLLTDITVAFEGFDAYEVEPPSLPDLFAQRPLILFGKYHNATGKIKVQGKTAGGNYEKEITVSPSMEDTEVSALKYLWAREKIARLSDYGKVGADVSEEIKDLGLHYSLMTEYTSFVAVDTVVRETGEVVTVKQPLPLPEGVSDFAVGQASMKSSGSFLGPLFSAAPRSSTPRSELDRMSNYQKNKESAPQLYLTGGTFPPGITLAEVEKIIQPHIKKELEEVLKKGKMTNLTIRLEVEKGRVVKVTIVEYKGKECKEEQVEKICKKLVFPASLKGSLKLTLEYS